MIIMAVKGIIGAGGVVWTIHQRWICMDGAERWRKRKGSGENLLGRYTLRRSVDHPDGSLDHQRVRVSL